MLASLTPTSRAVLTIAAQVSSGSGTPFLVRSARILRSGSPGISTVSTPATGLVCPDEVDIARDFVVEVIAGVDHLGIDIEGEHAVGELPAARGGAGAGQRAAEQFADERKPRALVLAERADRACPLGVVARPVRRVRPVEHRRLLAQRAVGIDQRARRQFLAAAACHQHLAFGDDRGGEIEHDRILPLARNADAIGRGRQPLLDAAERRHQQRARGVDEVHRHQPFGGGHFGPVADAADMPGVAQRDRGKPRLLALLDADPHRERRHGLAIAELAIDHGERRRIDDNLGGLVGNDVARLLPADIDRHPDHAVAVMAGEIGCREIGRDAPGFLGRGFRMRKNLGDEIDQIVDLDGDHFRISALTLHRESRRYQRQTLELPHRF